MKKHQPAQKEPRARKKPTTKKPSITARDVKEAARLFTALSIAAEFAAEASQGAEGPFHAGHAAGCPHAG
jgi:hypothetical protein